MKLPLRSLTIKLTLAFLLVSLGGIALVAVLVLSINSVEFNRYLSDRGLSDFTLAATQYYEARESWTGVEQYLQQQGLINLPAQPASGEDNPSGGINPLDDGNPPSGGNPPPQPFILTDANRKALIPFGRYQVGDIVPVSQNERVRAITEHQQTVGYVIATGRPPRQDPFAASYISRTNQALVLAAIGAGILAVLLGLLLARTITRPVRDLTAATRAMAEGNLSQQVAVRSQDEIGELTHSFNKMSADLERSNNLRKQMTADIAHDLRSPLTVITGYLEGLKDGVVKPSHQRFSAMYDEAVYLQRLVEDLRTLSLADAGELSIAPQRVQPGDLVERLVTSFRQPAEQKQVSIRGEVSPGLPAIRVDPERMQQAIGNLISNALRYTEAGGEIVVSARQAEGGVALEVRDTGAGIEEDVLPHVFERFYRSDSSRQEGGSGLGLAIARSITELHGGKIQATSEGPGKGSHFTVVIPAEG